MHVGYVKGNRGQDRFPLRVKANEPAVASQGVQNTRRAWLAESG